MSVWVLVGLLVVVMSNFVVILRLNAVEERLSLFNELMTALSGLPEDIGHALGSLSDTLTPQVNLQPAPNVLELLLARFIEGRLNTDGHGEEESGPQTEPVQERMERVEPPVRSD